jgi:hypothetical protein
VGWFTCDGAAVNGTTLREFAKEISVTDEGWEAREHEILYVSKFFFRLMFDGSSLFIRCMEHSLHLAAKHFVEVISPVSLASVRKKATAALNLAREGGHLNMEELERALFVVDAADNDDEDSNDYSTGDGLDVDDDPEFTPGDALGKALAFVKQVCVLVFWQFAPLTLVSLGSDVASSKNLLQVFLHTSWYQASRTSSLGSHAMGITLQVS